MVLADAVNNSSGQSFSQVKGDIHLAYMAGRVNKGMRFETDLQREAYYAGKKDAELGRMIAKKKAGYATVYGKESGFIPNDASKNVSPKMQKALNIVAKALGLKVMFVDNIFVNKKGDQANAAMGDDGIFRISANSSQPLYELIIHEPFHRMRQFATQEYYDAMNFAVQHAEQLGLRLEQGNGAGTYYEALNNLFNEKGISHNDAKILDELAAQFYQKIVSSDADALRFIQEMNKTEKSRNALEKFMDFVKDLIENLKKLVRRLKNEGEYAAAKQLNMTIKELEQARKFYLDAYRATRQAVENRRVEQTWDVKEDVNADENSVAKNPKKGYNKDVSYALKDEYWHTDLTKNQVIALEKELDRVGSPASTKITDTANWYMTRVNGNDVFVIYSTEDSKGPTILYETKTNAKLEKNLLMDILEAKESGKSDIEKSRIINQLLGGDWVQGQHDMADSNVGSRKGGSNTGNATVLQGEPPQFIGSKAFRNVLENLFEIQEAKLNDGETSYSLQDGVEVFPGKTETDAKGYTDQEYRDYGWARENSILSADQNADYRSKFAMAKSGQMKFPKSKKGEYIIPVSDIYDSDKEGINNVLVFAKGTIDKPVITSIIEIYEYDETSLDEKRRYIYACERRGIQPEIGNVFERYNAIDFQDKRQRTVYESDGDSSDNGYGGRSGRETSEVERGVGEQDFSLMDDVEVSPKKTRAEKNTDQGDGVSYSLKDADYTLDDVKTIQSVGRKSVNAFTTEDIKKTEKFAQKYWSEMGVKSPFFRAWFGDWRENDKTSVDVLNIQQTGQKNPRGKYKNDDTGFVITSSAVGYDETISHSGKDQLSIIAMQNIDKIIEKSILLDTEVSEPGRGKKSIYTCFMHKFYAPVLVDGKQCIAKLTVDESYQPGANDTNKKFYHVRAIKIEPASSVGIGFNHTPIMDKSGSTITVADLFENVKQNDKDFNPNPASKIVDEDGNPLVVYHGSKEDFSVFDKTKQGLTDKGAWGKGFYFTPDKSYADFFARGGQSKAYYLSVTNPFKLSDYQTVEEISDYLGVRKPAFRGDERAMFRYDNDGKILLNTRYSQEFSDAVQKKKHDGVIAGSDIVVFDPEQIKSATDNIGTFDGNNPDVNFSLMDDVEVSPRRTRELLDSIAYLKGQFETTKFAKADPKKLKTMTRKFLKEYSSNLDLDETTNAMGELYRYMANGEDGHPAAWDETFRRAKEIAGKIAESALETDDSNWVAYEDLRKYIRSTTMYIRPDEISDARDFNRRNMGRMRITTTDRTAMGVDEMFQELAEIYPEYFNEDKAGSGSDLLYKMEEVLDSLRPLEFNPFASDMDAATTAIANDMIQNFFEVPQAKPTFADKAEQRVAKARLEGAKKVAAQRESAKKALEKAKASKEKALERERKKSDARVEKMSENRKAQVLRAKITRVVGNLSRKLVRPTDNQHIPQELQGVVAKLLESINMASNYTYDPETKSYKKSDGYSYRALTSKPDMRVSKLSMENLFGADGKLERRKIVEKGIENVRQKNNAKNTEENVYVYVPDIDRNVLVTKDGLRHGLSRNAEATARVTLNIGDILENSIRVNELVPRKNTIGGYVLLGIAQDENKNYYPVRVVVNQYSAVEEVEALGVLYAVNAKKKNQSSNEAGFTDKSAPLIKGSSTISIADLLELVKND